MSAPISTTSTALPATLIARPVAAQRVFISYARADDEPKQGARDGWVSTFVANLESDVARQMGGDTVAFWMDPQLEPQRQVDQALRQRLGESDIVVALMSPRYLASAWCRGEMATFVDEVCGGHPADRVFIVELLPTDRGAWHAAVRGLTGLTFWTQSLRQPEAKTLGWPLPDVRGDRDYWDEVNALATRLARQLRERASVPQAAGVRPTVTAPVAPVAGGMPVAPAPVPLNPNGPLTLLISTNEHDEPLAAEAQALLADLDADALISTPPAENEAPADYRANFETQLHESHGVIVVYGQAPRSWVQSKFGEIRKVLALARKGTWAGVLEGPPEPKVNHGLPPRGLMVLDCKQGMNKEALQRFLHALRGEGGHV